MNAPQTNRGIDFKDETIICCDCGEAFSWSYGEQLYYRDRSLSPPHRCPQCREQRRKRINPVSKQHGDTDDTCVRAQAEIEKWRHVGNNDQGVRP